jgi:hypothetical protein
MPDPDAAQTLACPACGAALPSEAQAGRPFQCRHCGNLVVVPDKAGLPGGVTFSGGRVTVGGDVVGGDKITFGSASPARRPWWRRVWDRLRGLLNG